MTSTQQRRAIPPWTLGWRLQRSLSWAGKTTTDIADELGISRSTVSRWINDRGRPTSGLLKLWADECGVPREWLLEGEDGRAPRDSNPQPSDLCIELTRAELAVAA